MKQVVQHLNDGRLELADVPCPALRPGHLIIRTRASLVSPGTERMLLDFGKGGLISKARRQPERVRQVLEKARTDGLLETIDAVRSKLDRPIPLGYCNVGEVIDIGAGVEGFAVGDRVVSNGYHAELVQVPKHLCAQVPDEVTDEAAAFTVLGAVALQGVRLAAPTIGELFVVSGLGLVGLLAVQILRAGGCRVIGADPDADRVAMATRFGAEPADLTRSSLSAIAMVASRNAGIDGVIIAASTSSSEPVHQAAQVCRKRGRIVLVGVTGLELSRADFYAKELTFQVSCAYGPGRYDSRYEEAGHDYPIGFVRWTEQRNFEAVLQMLAERRLDPVALISHRFNLEEAGHAYETIRSAKRSLGVVIQYPRRSDDNPRGSMLAILPAAPVLRSTASPVLAMIGAGEFARRVLLPCLRDNRARMRVIASEHGLSSGIAARKYGFECATSSSHDAIHDPQVNLVMVATRHDSHAALVCEALAADRHVFVEKPLALSGAQLTRIEHAYSSARGNPILMVGFNRRFAPHITRIKWLLEAAPGPKSFVMTVNAGALPLDHWTRDRERSGGRLVGEACHFIDLLRYLAANRIARVASHPIRGGESASIALEFTDGSIGTIHYLVDGHRSFPKERLEIFAAGAVLQLDNFMRLRGFGWPAFREMNFWRQDKGHRNEIATLFNAIRTGGAPPIPFDQIIEVARATLEIGDRVR